MQTFPSMERLVGDLRYGVRLLARNPGFTTAAIATLALGIAGNTAVFSVIDAVLLRPLPYPDPARIMMFQNTFLTGRSGSAAPTEFNWWRFETTAFQDISAYTFNVANLTGESFPEQIPTMLVSADFFRLCGASAVEGRMFTPADDLPNAPKTVVLTYAFWQRHFGGDPGVIGHRMILNGQADEVIGVASPGGAPITEQSLLSGDIDISDAPDVYLPFQLDPYSASHGHYFNVAGRLRPGVTLAAANAGLQAAYREFARRWPGIDMPGRSFAVRPLQNAIVGGVRKALLLLWGAVGLVLLIACSNFANLLLARAVGRKRELAIRMALGAGRARIVRQLLMESLMLSLAGGMLGLAAGYAGIRALLWLMPGRFPRLGAGGSNICLDWRIFGFIFALSLLTGVVFGMVPAWQSSHVGWMRGASRIAQIRALLVATEVALAVVLLIGAALLIRSFVAIRQVNPGLDAQHILTMRVSLVGPQLATPKAVNQVIREGVRRIRALPGVEIAATTCCMPLELPLHGSFQIAGRPPGPDSQGLMGWARVSPGYFETFRIPVLRGRSFSQQDETGPPVVIINQTLTRQFWPNGDPLRDRITFTADASQYQIIGVVGDVREEALDRNPRPNLYLLSSQMTGTALVADLPWVWVVRTRGAPLSLAPAVQSELRGATGGLPVAQTRTMEEIVSLSTASRNLDTLLLTVFGCSALLLAAIGIYGLLAYSVAQRTREIGVRLALGAESSRIRRMVMAEGMRFVLAGIACGLAAALTLTHLLSGLLFGVHPWDPVAFSLVPMLLASVGLVAFWLPAQRASQIDPVQSLRHE